MRLIEKTGRAYFWISLSAFVVAGAIIYFALTYILRKTLNENLLSDIEAVKRNIAEKNIIPSYSPYIDVKEVAGSNKPGLEASDTLIFDQGEQESITFRQVSRLVSINGKNYLITAREALLEKSDLALTIAVVTGSVLIALLVIIFLVNRKLSLRLWKPFYRILDELKRFSFKSNEFRFSSAGDLEEFNELKYDLEILTGKILSDYQALKRFSEDASHEMQTPLAIIQSKLETLMQHADLDKEQYELINTAYSYTLKVSRLAQTLLLLTKISNDQFADKQMVNLSEILKEKISVLEDIFNDKQLTVMKDIEEGIKKETNTYLAESLVMNLLMNAFSHSSSYSTVGIVLDENELIISNTGLPFLSDPDKMFDRFFKEDKSSSSHGLGLSIVKEICSANRWKIRYQYENGRHNFIVTF